jgi:hypothetical protein
MNMMEPLDASGRGRQRAPGARRERRIQSASPTCQKISRWIVYLTQTSIFPRFAKRKAFQFFTGSFERIRRFFANWRSGRRCVAVS